VEKRSYRELRDGEGEREREGERESARGGERETERERERREIWPTSIRVETPSGDSDDSDDSEFLFATQGAENGCWLVWHGILPLVARERERERERLGSGGKEVPTTPSLFLLHSRDARIVRGAGDWLLARHFRWPSPFVSLLLSLHDGLHAAFVARALEPLWRLSPSLSLPDPLPSHSLSLFTQALRVPRRRRSAKERERDRRAERERERERGRGGEREGEGEVEEEEEEEEEEGGGWRTRQRGTEADRERDRERGDYERLEHLGDLVLGAAVALAVFYRDPGAAEGSLSSTRSMYVSNAALGSLSLSLSLDEHVLFRTRPAFLRDLRGGKTTGIATSSKVWADAYEAVVGAVFLSAQYSLSPSPRSLLPAAHSILLAHRAAVSKEAGVVPPSLRETDVRSARALLLSRSPHPHPHPH
jgi:dsRNA-specific ribonuclease